MFGYLSTLFSNPGQFFLQMLYRVPAILIALTVHECAHGWVAYKLGDPTAKMMGRLSLNPLKHMDPVGTVMLLVLGFGYAKPVPINPRNFKKPLRDDTLVSLAGVTANFIMFFIVYGIMFGLSVAGISLGFFSGFLTYFVSINLSLMLFNLLPIPPLDGFHVVNNIFFKGRIYVTPQIQQYTSFAIMILAFSGMLSSILSFGINGIWDFANWAYYNLFRLFGII